MTNPELKSALTDKLLALADDEMILAHRNSEWTGHGPILEEDIAFSNIAQDEMGHATLWYACLQELSGDDPDQLVFFRDADKFRNVQMVELPKGDWGFSMLRQYLFDVAELVQLKRLVDSAYQPMADAATKMRQEELYHLRHTSQWVKRLGLGTEESHQRMQNALDTLWPYAQQLFVALPDEQQLVDAEVVPAPADSHQEWLRLVQTHLQESGLQLPENDTPPTTSRSQHSRHLATLVDEMQSVARQYPEAEW